MGAMVASMATFVAAPSYAQMGARDVVVDSNGRHVVDSRGHCVHTKWDLNSDKCHAMVVDERVIYFGYNSSELSAAEKAKIEKLATLLEHHKITDVKIVGYTDRIGSGGYNHTLSHKRADAVKAYLDTQIKLKSSVVEVRGLGKSHQVKGCDGMKGDELISCLAPNRRVEVESDYLK